MVRLIVPFDSGLAGLSGVGIGARVRGPGAMSALDRFEVDPDQLAAAALQAPRCQCDRPCLDEWGDCEMCGREIRGEGSLSRAFRIAAYMRRLAWARGAGLDARRDFRGLSDECGSNPPLDVLDAALRARVAALPALDDDPLLGRREPLSSLVAA
jgi:hypothetical protein